MAIAWSRISSKVIVHPPEACRRRCGNWQGRLGVCIPQMAARRKREVRGARRSRDAALTATREEVSRVRGYPSRGIDPHEIQEHTMSPHKRDAKHHTKAKRRRYRTAQERLARDRRQAQRAAEA